MPKEKISVSKSQGASKTRIKKKCGTSALSGNRCGTLAKNQLINVIFFMLAVLTFSLIVVKGENVWKFTHSAILGLFGVTSFLWPVLLIYTSILNTIKDKGFNFKRKLILGMLTLLFTSILICLIFNQNYLRGTFFDQIKALYMLGLGYKSAGVVSGIFGIFLSNIFGISGAKIFSVLMLWMSLILFFNADLSKLVIFVANMCKKVPKFHFRNFVSKKLTDENENEGIASVESVKSEATSDQNYTNADLTGNKPQTLVSSAKYEKDFSRAKIAKDGYEYPPIYLLRNSLNESNSVSTNKELKSKGEMLINILKNFSVQAKIINISRGPAVTRFELQPACGTKISRITNLSDDIALNLAALDIRIEAPIPGKSALGIEVPNKIVNLVRMQELVNSADFVNSKSKLTVVLGKDIEGKVKIADLAKMPHILIAGSTGSGKSVCINSFIVSLLYKSSPNEVKLIMVDPKVVELGIYNGIPHLMVPVVTDPRKASNVLNWAVIEMLKRYKLFAKHNVRDLTSYNKLVFERKDNNSSELEFIPQVVIIIDELADLMMASPKEVEDSICRLAQMARAAGMHLVIATQRPSVNVITGVIKANIPSRIALAVSSQVDSRTILDCAGAEKLLGRGDMLFSPIGALKPIRVQGCYVSDKEIESVIEYIKLKNKNEYNKELMKEMERINIGEDIDPESRKGRKYFKNKKADNM